MKNRFSITPNEYSQAALDQRMATATDELHERITQVFRPHFPASEFVINIANSVKDYRVVARIRDTKTTYFTDAVTDQTLLALDRPETNTVLSHHAREAARSMYEYSIRNHLAGNLGFGWDPYDPDLCAIEALVTLVDGKIVRRLTPILVPGEENLWVLCLPKPETLELVPIKEYYFSKPLDWWQRFITHVTGAAP